MQFASRGFRPCWIYTWVAVTKKITFLIGCGPKFFPPLTIFITVYRYEPYTAGNPTVEVPDLVLDGVSLAVEGVAGVLAHHVAHTRRSLATSLNKSMRVCLERFVSYAQRNCIYCPKGLSHLPGANCVICPKENE